KSRQPQSVVGRNDVCRTSSGGAAREMSDLAPRIISLGSINVDIQLRARRHPDLGETVIAEDYAILGGGRGANVALAAQLLGAPAILIGRVGDDPLATPSLERLRQVGVDLMHVQTARGRATGTAVVIVRPDGEKSVVLAPNANEAWTEGDID